MKELAVGDSAPDFSLLSQTGKKTVLSDYFGKQMIVLYFYPQDESYGCTKEACRFRDEYEVFKAHGAEVIGISSDPVAAHQSFAANHQLPFVLLSDPDGEVRNLYGVKTTLGFIPGRVTFIIDLKGTIKHIFNSQFRPQQHITNALAIISKLTQPPDPN